MRWRRRGKIRRRTSDWDFFSGYPPDLTMRRRVGGQWQYRKATEEECASFLRDESQFEKRPQNPRDKPLI